MDKHVDLLGLLLMMWGALSLLLALALLILAAGAATLMGAANTPERTSGLAAGMLALVFSLLAIVGVLWGALNVGIGAGLRGRRATARLVALVLSVMNLLFVPFGTALGIYGLWTLLHRQGRAVFEP